MVLWYASSFGRRMSGVRSPEPPAARAFFLSCNNNGFCLEPRAMAPDQHFVVRLSTVMKPTPFSPHVWRSRPIDLWGLQVSHMIGACSYENKGASGAARRSGLDMENCFNLPAGAMLAKTGRESPVRRASDCRDGGPRFDSGSRHFTRS